MDGAENADDEAPEVFMLILLNMLASFLSCVEQVNVDELLDDLAASLALD
jgi:hypothetical protein